MTPYEKYDKIFIEILSADNNKLHSISRQNHHAWDSLAHMSLIAKIEECFNCRFVFEDIVSFTSYQAGIDILKKKDVYK
jgi:acyl carrier protein